MGHVEWLAVKFGARKPKYHCMPLIESPWYSSLFQRPWKTLIRFSYEIPSDWINFVGDIWWYYVIFPWSHNSLILCGCDWLNPRIDLGTICKSLFFSMAKTRIPGCPVFRFPLQSMKHVFKCEFPSFRWSHFLNLLLISKNDIPMVNALDFCPVWDGAWNRQCGRKGSGGDKKRRRNWHWI